MQIVVVKNVIAMMYYEIPAVKFSTGIAAQLKFKQALNRK